MRWKKTLAALVAISISGLAYAESVTPRTPYVTGQPITASEINTDFDNIHTAVNDNNTRIGTNISSINTITFTTIPGVSASIPTSINDLSDVNTADAANGKILKYSSGTLIVADDDVVNNLNGLSDVDTTGLTTNSVLKYNGSDTWVIGTDNDTNVTSIFGLTDVINTGNADGKVLKWDNGNSRFAPADDVGAVTITDLDNVGYPGSVAPTNGQVLKWNGSIWAPGNDAGGVGADSINQMSDVLITGALDDGYILMWSSGLNKWVSINTDVGQLGTQQSATTTTQTKITVPITVPGDNEPGTKTVAVIKNIRFSQPVRFVGLKLSTDFNNPVGLGGYDYDIYNVYPNGGDYVAQASNVAGGAWIRTENSGNSFTGIKELRLTVTEADNNFGTYVNVEGVGSRLVGGAEYLFKIRGFFSHRRKYTEAFNSGETNGNPNGDIAAIIITPGTVAATATGVTEFTNIINAGYTIETYKKYD
jgi:hypothetical protein